MSLRRTRARLYVKRQHPLDRLGLELCTLNFCSCCQKQNLFPGQFSVCSRMCQTLANLRLGGLFRTHQLHYEFSDKRIRLVVRYKISNGFHLHII